MLLSDSWRIFSSFSLRGGVDEKRLAASVSAVVSRQPMLNGRIHQSESGAFIEPDNRMGVEIRFVQLEQGSVEQEMNTPLSGSLVRATLFRSGDEDVFSLVVAHVVADGISLITLLQDMWKHYAGSSLSRLSQEFPDSLASRLPETPASEIANYAEKRMALAPLLPPARLPAPQSAAPRALRAERIKLSLEQTSAFARVARAAAVSQHGIITAALLIGLRRCLPENGAVTMSCWQPVDLRSQLTPTVPRDAMFCCVGHFINFMEVQPDTAPLELAKSASGELRAAVSTGEVIVHTQPLPLMIGNPNMVKPSLILTNLGAIGHFSVLEGLELTDFRWFPVTQEEEGALVASAITVGDRLHLEFPYRSNVYGREQIQDVVSAVRDVVSEIVDG